MHLRMPGQVYDEDALASYNWNRWYRPEDGRYLSPDPIGLRGGDPSLFSYGASSPMSTIDVDGLRAFEFHNRPASLTPKPGWDPWDKEHEPRDEQRLGETWVCHYGGSVKVSDCSDARREGCYYGKAEEYIRHDVQNMYDEHGESFRARICELAALDLAIKTAVATRNQCQVEQGRDLSCCCFAKSSGNVSCPFLDVPDEPNGCN